MLNEKGQEVLDPNPLVIPAGFERPLTLQEQIRRLMRTEYQQLLQTGADPNDIESPEEAEDFDVDDDFDPASPFEEGFMPDDPPEAPITQDPEFNPNADKVKDSKTAEETPIGEGSAETKA